MVASCTDLCDEVLRRLKDLGFTWDEDNEDHSEILGILAKVKMTVDLP